MNALARTDEPAQRGAQLVSKPRVPIVDKPMPSGCIKIENAFDSADEGHVRCAIVAGGFRHPWKLQTNTDNRMARLPRLTSSGFRDNSVRLDEVAVLQKEAMQVYPEREAES
ncbi:hypothetical protein BDV95DRAFT_563218 [Massariosphaeria phaeospora]|uniref:Splicing factor RBM39 linker domain-containing protein n=1 Tax=Massariosphaeria phaeospora TaxID=100035 RepID=A0A7C8IC78_9PLEO|nr:hypothetical protein BDV95DRAFT_563218 [Massariosphaeria phaeospora]